jgi:hypothetical protein
VVLEKKIIFEGAMPGLEGDWSRGKDAPPPRAETHQIFLLSPANAAGLRAQRLLSTDCQTERVLKLRAEGMRLGELFSFMSSLYFRGKLTYAQRFAAPPGSCPGVLVITPSRGLLHPETVMRMCDLEEMATARVDLEDERYRVPLERDARGLMERLDGGVRVVLLGSIATPKYVQPLVRIFGRRLVFPAEFVGRGDMSRGGLLLRSVREAMELEYLPVTEAELGTARAREVTNAGRLRKNRS